MVRISERVPVEVTELLAVFVVRTDELILGLLESLIDAVELFDTDEEALTVIDLYIVIEGTVVRDMVEALVDVLLCRLERVIVVELEDVLDCIGDNDDDTEPSGVNDARADILTAEDTDLEGLFVIALVAEALDV